MWNSTGEKRILQGITVCLVSAVLSTVWWPGCFQTMSRGHILVFFNRHWSTMNLVKEKQGGLVPTGLKRWPIKLIKHFADATGVSPSPAGPAGCCPLKVQERISVGTIYKGKSQLCACQGLFSVLNIINLCASLSAGCVLMGFWYCRTYDFQSTGFIQARLCKNSRTFQGLLKDFPTVFKYWKLKKNTGLHVIEFFKKLCSSALMRTNIVAI